ncbi:MAG: c-type cytochrome [Acidobacteria bacterium]|nr:c-type cytochrome [Acidobacteriota bacterium]
MRVPPSMNIVVLVLGATAFYTIVGQLVPQKEVPAPEVIEISKDVTTEEMVEIGKGIAQGKGTCLTCHTIGQSGSLRFPDLDGIGTRAATRIPGMSAVDYLAQSLYEPNAYVVEGFNPGMPVINKPPIQLTDDEILAVIAFLQSLGGTPSVTMETKLSINGGAGGDSTATATAALVQEAASLDGKALFERYGCARCHATTLPGKRLDRAEVLASILSPDSITTLAGAEQAKKRQAMEQSGVYDKATLQEIDRIVDYLMEQKAKE